MFATKMRANRITAEVLAGNRLAQNGMKIAHSNEASLNWFIDEPRTTREPTIARRLSINSNFSRAD